MRPSIHSNANDYHCCYRIGSNLHRARRSSIVGAFLVLLTFIRFRQFNSIQLYGNYAKPQQ